MVCGQNTEGGYSHAPDDLYYGVDIKQIHWCGILQVSSSLFLVFFLIDIHGKDPLSSGTHICHLQSIVTVVNGL